MNRFELITKVARNLGDLVGAGTSATLSPTTMDAGFLVHPLTDQLKGNALYVLSAPSQERTITGFLPANNRMVVDETFGLISVLLPNLIVTKNLKMSDYLSHFGDALSLARKRHLNIAVGTLALVATQYEYPLPSVAEGFDYVSSLRLVPSGNTDYGAVADIRTVPVIPDSWYSIGINSGGTRVIIFDSDIAMSELGGNLVSVVGLVKPNVAATDSGIIPADLEDYLTIMTTYLAASSHMGDHPRMEPRAAVYGKLAKELESYVFTYRRGHRVP